jgi:hypothetical protein
MKIFLIRVGVSLTPGGSTLDRSLLIACDILPAPAKEMMKSPVTDAVMGKGDFHVRNYAMRGGYGYA